jgi:hypothetical protein
MSRYNGMMYVVVVTLALTLAGCGGAGAPAASTGSTPAAAVAAAAGGTPVPGASEEYASAALPASYENALPASTQLALGILRLEGTPQAVTPAQAKTLLPFWQAFQGSALQNQTEQNAVLKQIEGVLTAEQVQAIAAMQLTQDDMRKWMEESGMQAGMPPGTPFPGGPGGAPPDMTDEQRAAFRATAEASGGQFFQGRGTPGAGGPGNMTDEQRQAFRATVEASGGQFPGGGQRPGARGTPGAGGAGGQVRFFSSMRIFVGPLVELLTERAGQ